MLNKRSEKEVSAEKKFVLDLYSKIKQELEEQFEMKEQEFPESINRKVLSSTFTKSPILWGIPSTKRHGGRPIDDFKYGSKYEEKTVYIPFSDIQRQVAEANYEMHPNLDHFLNLSSNSNYIVGHMVFIVSTKPHPKSSREQTKNYQGERDYVDFPLVKGLSKFINESYKKERHWSKFVSDFRKKNNLAIGYYEHGNDKTDHSEVSLKSFLTSKDNINDFIVVLKRKLEIKYGTAEGHKIYAVSIFLNSTCNICTTNMTPNANPQDSCDKKFAELFDADKSFITTLSNKLSENGLVLPKSKKIRVFFSVTAHRAYYNEEAEKYITACEAHPQGPVDIKLFANKFVLSADEVAVTKKVSVIMATEAKAKVKEKLYKVPFYTGFKNGNIPGKNPKQPFFQVPKNFDGVPLVTFENSEKESLLITRLNQEIFDRKQLNEELTYVKKRLLSLSDSNPPSSKIRRKSFSDFIEYERKSTTRNTEIG